MEIDQPANDDSTNQQSISRQNEQVRLAGRDEMITSESENDPRTMVDNDRSHDDDTATMTNNVAAEDDNNNIVSVQGCLENAGKEAQHFNSSESSSEEGESSDSESGACDDSEDGYDYDENDGLSDYERLRLRNIQRNEARLAQLGLLTNATSCSANTTNISDSGDIAQGIIGSIQQAQRSRKEKKKKTAAAAPVPRRSLPPRRCAKLKRKKSSIARSSSSIPFRERGSTGSSMIESECGYDSDESSLAASPVKISRTLRPQPHQEELDENHLKHYLKTRRVRRGRPKRGEYVYACDERCKECGGEWNFDNNTGENDENDEFGVGDGADLEERTRLIRCKDCRGAFHLSCMLVHGKHVEEDDGSKPAAVDISSASADGTRVEDSLISVENKENHESRNVSASLSEYTEGDAKKKEKSEEDRMSTSTDIDTFEESCSTHDPKRCHLCEVKRRAQQKHKPRSSPSVFPPLLEATIGGKTMQVRVNPEPALESNAYGKTIMCYVTLRGVMNDTTVRSSDTSVDGKRKGVTWGSPIEDAAKEDATTRQLRKLIDKALSNGDHARLQDYSCAALRKRILAENDDGDEGEQTMATIAATAVRLGGICMLAGSMRHHPERPTIQAEAMCTLSEITWICPHLGIETINRNVDNDEGSVCLDLAIVAMERHGVHSKVQQMGCGYLRALSYDADCCTRLKESRAVATVVDSIRRNPRKVDVVMEGSMFLQNMMVVSPTTTAKIILRSKRSGHAGLCPDIISALTAAIKTNQKNLDLVFSVFGLLSIVALDAKGSIILRRLGAGALAVNVIRDHPSSPGLHEAAFALLQNVLTEGGSNNEQKIMLELVKLVLQSMEKHPEEEILQINGCQLLSVVVSPQTSSPQRTSMQSILIGSEDNVNILTLASENFPDGCKDLVDDIVVVS